MEKKGHTRKSGSVLEIWVTLEKMNHTWENGSHVTHRKMSDP